MKRRILSALTLLPSNALAFESDPADPTDGELGAEIIETVYLDEDDFPFDNDLAYAGYIEMMFTGEDPGYFPGMGTFSTGSETAGSAFTGNVKTVYDAIVTRVRAIAAGGGSTKVDFSSTPISVAELKKVYQAVCFDCPYEMYWRGLGYSYSSYSDSEVISISI